jgi:hypothetical protein
MAGKKPGTGVTPDIEYARVHIDAKNGFIKMGTRADFSLLEGSEDVLLVSKKGAKESEIRVGRGRVGGQAGVLSVRDRKGKDTIVLDGPSGRISNLGDLHVGGTEKAGKVRVRNAQGKDTIVLDGTSGMIWNQGSLYTDGLIRTDKLQVHNAQGKNTILIDGELGDISLAGADCAENFDVVEGSRVSPGTVLVMSDSGDLQPCRKPYDKRVAGVVSGGGTHRPGLILDYQGDNKHRASIALVGKVSCKVDATAHPIEVGDLLTTSSTEGHAQKAGSKLDAFGSVIGKALKPISSGRGLIPILVALQ